MEMSCSSSCNNYIVIIIKYTAHPHTRAHTRETIMIEFVLRTAKGVDPNKQHTAHTVKTDITYFYMYYVQAETRRAHGLQTAHEPRQDHYIIYCLVTVTNIHTEH